MSGNPQQGAPRLLQRLPLAAGLRVTHLGGRRHLQVRTHHLCGRAGRGGLGHGHLRKAEI